MDLRPEDTYGRNQPPAEAPVKLSRRGLLETWVVETLALAEATHGLAAVAPMTGQRSEVALT